MSVRKTALKVTALGISAPGLLFSSLASIGPMGCAGPSSRPLSASMFVPPSTATGSDVPLIAGPATTAVDVEKPLPTTGEAPKHASVLPADEPALPNIQPIQALSTPPTTEPAAVPASQPTVSSTDSAPVASDPVPVVKPAIGQGVYMTLGGVIAIVDNRPIYANQILNPLNRELTVKSRDLSEAEFKRFAIQEIGKQFNELVEDEVYFATAYQALSEDDHKLAKAIMVQIRQERITAAGGSVEQARQQAIDAGEDFDDLLDREYRGLIHSLYQRRKIEPLIQVSAQDMREFYRQKADALFSDKDRAQFRVIEIDPAVAGGTAAAMDKINALRDRAMHGEDFAALATNFSDDDFLKKRGGSPTDPGEWMDKNAYPNDVVEAAVWQIEPGQITPVVKNDGKLYIAKLEAKHIGGTKPFDDAKVQEQIYNQLRQKQVAILSEHSREESLNNGVIDTTEDRMQITLDMAMQKFAAGK